VYELFVYQLIDFKSTT